MGGRQPAKGAAPRTDLGVARGIYNLHDAYLNATLSHSLMLEASPWVDPVRFRDPDPAVRISEFARSNRGRLERIWITFLAVLVEAWRKAPRPIKDRVRQIAPAEVSALRGHLRDSRRVTKLVSVRDYMVHRDVRDYWDAGRLAQADESGALAWNSELHAAFGAVLRPAISWANNILGVSDQSPEDRSE